MDTTTMDFSLQVEGIKGACPAGERYASEQIASRRVPVLSCEGPCLRGEIARLAASLVAKEVPGLARACHAEAFFVPHSAMNRWVRSADRSVMIDGCFLECHGRVLRKLVREEKVIHIDAYSFYRKYADAFLVDDVPEAERRAMARKVADGTIARLREEAKAGRAMDPSTSWGWDARMTVPATRRKGGDP